MSLRVCLAANTVYYPGGGGHRWVYLNWALGLRALGCEVVWLEEAEPDRPATDLYRGLAALKQQLEPYGLASSVAVCSAAGLPPTDCLELDAAAEADLLVNLRYGLPQAVVERFRRSVLVDIDPGLLQLWMAGGQVHVPRHDVYVTTSEAVAFRTSDRIPDAGISWQHAPPCVALDWWPVCAAPDDAPFTTVSHWGTTEEWVADADGFYRNDKQVGFEPFLDLPRRVTRPLELALCLSEWQECNDGVELRAHGWRVRHASTVASTPWDYQHYIQRSFGEFSCVKPSCVRLRNAWVSDRTLCYLASGKPAVVQHTGPSRLLPGGGGLLRFGNVDEAARAIRDVTDDYDKHCRLARELAQEVFDARTVAGRLLEVALP
ncbi:MAG: hypothetical protein ACRDQ7_15310 [Haloechinothrix sp.]